MSRTVQSAFARPAVVRSGWLAASIIATPLTAAEGSRDGESLFKELGCVACHGADGSHPVSEDYPVIAGQNAPYLLTQMKDIRDGRRANGLSETMRMAIGEVRDEELIVIAEWLSNRW